MGASCGTSTSYLVRLWKHKVRRGCRACRGKRDPLVPRASRDRKGLRERVENQGPLDLAVKRAKRATQGLRAPRGLRAQRATGGKRGLRASQAPQAPQAPWAPRDQQEPPGWPERPVLRALRAQKGLPAHHSSLLRL